MSEKQLMGSSQVRSHIVPLLYPYITNNVVFFSIIPYIIPIIGTYFTGPKPLKPAPLVFRALAQTSLAASVYKTFAGHITSSVPTIGITYAIMEKKMETTILWGYIGVYYRDDII